MSEADKQKYCSTCKNNNPRQAETVANRSIQATESNKSQHTICFANEEAPEAHAGKAFGGAYRKFCIADAVNLQIAPQWESTQ